MGNSSLLALCFTDDRATGSTACTECYSDWCTNKNFFIKNITLTAASGALSAIGLELHAPSQCNAAPPMGENGQPGCGACRRLGLHWRLQMFDGVLAAMADHGKDDHGSDKDKGAPGGPGELFERLLGANNPVLGQLDKNARALAQSALAKLDVVPRAEFDAQAAVLQRTRLRVETLEAELTKLTAQLDALERHQGGD